MKKKKVKQYEIDSFERLCNVINRKNFESLTTDLLLWLGYHVQMMEELRKEFPKLKNKLNSELGKSTFIWIDDGKNETKEVIIRNQWTGEVKIFKLKP